MFVGRKKEKEILNAALASNEAELVAVIGRRRVGKTFLVRNTYRHVLKFELTGIQHGTRAEQLRNFAEQLTFYSKAVIPFQSPKDWFDAFNMLKLYLGQLDKEQKIAIFFDELPWMATHRSGFLKAFGIFWNSWASQENIVVVICGSAASWMIQKVVRNKGGLHNRITRRISLQPFNLAETKAFFRSRNIQLDDYQIIQIYMAMGGIPHYLKEVQSGKSASQNIDAILFSRNGLLRDEFESLYPALFDNSTNHIKIIELLAQKWKGLSRAEIIKKGKFPNGGTLTKTLDELTQAGFITPFYSFGKKKKGMLYRLVDEYSIFYLKFIQNKRLEEEGTWAKFSQGQSYKVWAGYAFENICLKHIAQIKKALGISGIYSEASVFQAPPQNGLPGVQIDLVIDRNDLTINLFEIKFYSSEFVISKAYAKELRIKKEVFKSTTQTKKQLFLGMMTTFGLVQNENSLGLLDNVLSMDILFMV